MADVTNFHLHGRGYHAMPCDWVEEAGSRTGDNEFRTRQYACVMISAEQVQGASRLPLLARYSALPPGWTRHRLERFVRAGEYERVAPGVFVRTGEIDDTTAAWIGIAAKRPEATLCLLSAAATTISPMRSRRVQTGRYRVASTP